MLGSHTVDRKVCLVLAASTSLSHVSFKKKTVRLEGGRKLETVDTRTKVEGGWEGRMNQRGEYSNWRPLLSTCCPSTAANRIALATRDS